MNFNKCRLCDKIKFRGSSRVLTTFFNRIVGVAMQSEPEPYLEIVRNTQKASFRFRYEAEGPKHGNVVSEGSVKPHETFPRVALRRHNLPESTPIKIRCSLYCDQNNKSMNGKRIPHYNKILYSGSQTGGENYFDKPVCRSNDYTAE